MLALAPVALVLLPLLAPSSAPPADAPLRVTIRAGVKTHGPGQHDHPRFLAEWTKLLEERGCEVQGGMTFPSADTLAETDVLVMYAANGGSIHGADRAALEAYLARGGGIVVIHDAVCGDDPAWYEGVVGGAWEDGHSKYYEGEIGLYFADHDHPITRGVANFDLNDEIYWQLHVSPDAQVLANAFHTPFDVTPQMWTYEKNGYRAFVAIQGHEWTTFSHPAWRALLLRGIAWAGKRDVDSLVAPEELASLAYPPGGPTAPDEARKTLEVAPGFDVDLVASEPLVVNPVAIEWDARGRAWVALTPGYPYKQESSGIPAHDQVVILEDTDGDGRADTRKVFADGLDLVTSLAFYRDGVIVTQAPDILWLRDTDGDDVCDQRVVLFQGFGYFDTHAVINNLRPGLDGWIYGTQGYSGNRSEDVTDGVGQKHFGRIPNGLFRFRPDGSAIEPVLSYHDNSWGCDFAADGELFFTMANGSHLRHVVLPDSALADCRMGDAPSWIDVTDHKEVVPLTHETRAPYVQIDFVGGFTAAASSLIYAGGQWPAEFAGNHFVCEPTVNLVHRDVLTARGPTFLASKPRQEEFLASRDRWFRPVYVRTGPDGELYVLDFYNQAAIHNDTRGPEHGPTNAAVRPDRDHQHGRIWRVRHEGDAERPVPDLADASRAERVATLAHPDRWWRMCAQRLLVEDEDLASDAGAVQALRGMAKGGPPLGRIHAGWVLQQRGLLGADLVAAALAAPEAAVRKNAIRWYELSDARDVGPLGPLIDDPDPRTRLLALAALEGRDVDADLARRLVALFPGLPDDWSDSAVLGALAGKPAQSLGLVLAAGDAALTPLARELAGRVADPAQRSAALVLLAGRVAEVPAQLTRQVLAGLDAKRDLDPTPEARAALATMLAEPRVEVAIAALPFAARFPAAANGPGLDARITELSQRLSSLAEDPDAELELRLSCVQVLLGLAGRGAEGVRVAGRFLDPYFAPEVQARVVDLLGKAAETPALEGAVVGALIEALPRLSGPARERVFHHLLLRPSRALLLLDRVADGTLSRADLGPQRIHALRGHPDPKVAARAAEILGAAGSGSEESARVDRLIEQMLPVVDAPGDAAHGKELFEKNCATCHSFHGEGAQVGPDLTGMGAHGARGLLPFVLDPNRTVDDAYVEYTLETVDGRDLSGVIAKEDQREIVLRSSSGEERVPRDQIAELRSTGRSPMPTGFEELGAEGLRDLVAFLAQGYEKYRVIDLKPFCDSSTERGMYDEKRDARPMRFRQVGIVDVEGVPFEILDPARVENDALVLKGGMVADWDSKLHRPQEVEIPVGFPLQRVHVLGGIAAWGYPFTQSRSPILRWTWVYADGKEETVEMKDGDRFADWIRRSDVPGSEWVDLLQDGSPGQVRRFTLDPGRRDVAVKAIRLESYDNHLAPTFIALTAQVAGADDEPPVPARQGLPDTTRILVVGGGTSHDFQRWFHERDFATLSEFADRLAYTELPDQILPVLAHLEVLVLCNNQPLSDPALREGILSFVTRGGGLLVLHAATWINWPDWPEYNALLVGGGAQSHEEYAEIEVRPTAGRADDPLLAGLGDPFRIEDELYRFEPDPAAQLDVLATGHSLATGADYPVFWTLRRGEGRVVACTLGHDGAAHESAAWRALLLNSVRWLLADPSTPPGGNDR